MSLQTKTYYFKTHRLSPLILIAILITFGTKLQAQLQLHAGYHEIIETGYSRNGTTVDQIPGIGATLVYSLSITDQTGIEIGTTLTYNTLTDNDYQLQSTYETPTYIASLDIDKIEAELHMTNIILPLRFNYTTHPIAQQVRMQFFAGVALNIAITYKTTYRFDHQEASADILQEDLLNRFNLETSVGIRTIIYDHYGFNLSYNSGLFNLNKPDYIVNGIYSLKHSHINAGIFYQF